MATRTSAAGDSCAARQRSHHRPPDRSRNGAGRRVISGDCIYSRRQITGHENDGVYIPLNNAVGSVWEQLKTIDKMNDELGGDLGRLVVLHDIERWKGAHRQGS